MPRPGPRHATRRETWLELVRVTVSRGSRGRLVRAAPKRAGRIARPRGTAPKALSRARVRRLFAGSFPATAIAHVDPV